MTRPPRIENKPANMRCNNCGEEFVASVPHVAIEADEVSEPIGWVPDNTGNARCPRCNSRMVGWRA